MMLLQMPSLPLVVAVVMVRVVLAVKAVLLFVQLLLILA
jgi:hypothetical protein